MVTRRGNAFDPIVLTCGKIAGGTASNIIPETVEMLGTLRTTSETARDHAHQGIRRVATNIAAPHLCEGEVDIKRGYPVTVNERVSWISHAASPPSWWAGIITSRCRRRSWVQKISPTCCNACRAA